MGYQAPVRLRPWLHTELERRRFSRDSVSISCFHRQVLAKYLQYYAGVCVVDNFWYDFLPVLIVHPTNVECVHQRRNQQEKARLGELTTGTYSDQEVGELTCNHRTMMYLPSTVAKGWRRGDVGIEEPIRIETLWVRINGFITSNCPEIRC